VATYDYRCPNDGDVEARFPLGEAPPTLPCPACGGAAGRVWSAPRLTRTPRALRTALDRAAASAETPQVVTRVPGRRPATPRASAHPAHSRLPRL